MYALVNDNNHVYCFANKAKLLRGWAADNNIADGWRINRVRVYDYVYHRFVNNYFGIKIPREKDLDKVGLIVVGEKGAGR